MLNLLDNDNAKIKPEIPNLFNLIKYTEHINKETGTISNWPCK